MENNMTAVVEAMKDLDMDVWTDDDDLFAEGASVNLKCSVNDNTDLEDDVTPGWYVRVAPMAAFDRWGNTLYEEATFSSADEVVKFLSDKEARYKAALELLSAEYYRAAKFSQEV